MRAHLLLAGATIVAATNPLVEIFEREPAPGAGIEKRGTKECMSVATKVLPSLTDIPTPDASLSSFIAEQTQWATITDPCAIPEVTGSMAKEYSSWASDLQDWYSEQQDGLSSLIKACSDVPEISSQLDGLGETASLCDSVHWASETGSSKKEDDDNAASGSPLRIGVVVAAAAAAGFAALA
ncbi:Fc.00g105230.m01.CDS01 [Cosmosporella sp. VM-42]